MNTKIQINPNLRLPGDLTVVDLDEDVVGPLRSQYQEVEVFEPTSGLRGPGWIVEVDQGERTVTVQVDWPRLVLPDWTTSNGTKVATFGLRASWNEDLRPRAVVSHVRTA